MNHSASNSYVTTKANLLSGIWIRVEQDEFIKMDESDTIKVIDMRPNENVDIDDIDHIEYVRHKVMHDLPNDWNKIYIPINTNEMITKSKLVRVKALNKIFVLFDVIRIYNTLSDKIIDENVLFNGRKATKKYVRKIQKSFKAYHSIRFDPSSFIDDRVVYPDDIEFVNIFRINVISIDHQNAIVKKTDRKYMLPKSYGYYFDKGSQNHYRVKLTRLDISHDSSMNV